MTKGKDYSCKKTKRTKDEKPLDNYDTPYCLTRVFLEKEKFNVNILEPASGNGAIVKVLKEFGYLVTARDLKTGDNFLSSGKYISDFDIVTNPPYSLADQFVLKAKERDINKFAFLLRMNYLNAQKRTKLRIFDGLKKIYTFNRMPNLSFPIREDGKFHNGMQTYGWYVWEKGWRGKKQLVILDVSEFVVKKGGCK